MTSTGFHHHKYLIAFIRVSCLSSVLIVGAMTRAQAQSPDLNTLIDGLQRKYSRMQGLEADFVQVYRGADGRVIRESGHLLLKRPGKARWEYSSPEHKVFVSDGKTVFFYVSNCQIAVSIR